jgi:hypothetical protein
MTDRELLEAAAKAVGIDAEWHSDDDADFDAEYLGMFLKGARSPDNNKYWNPLTDDGDALRLAVKCGIDICEALGWYYGDDENPEYDADPDAATRRAIVRAAAEIGRSMK